MITVSYPVFIMAKKSNRQVLVVFSDTHAGHKYGLLNPDTKNLVEVIEADANGDMVSRLELRPVNLTPVQEWLWKVYTKNIEDTFDMADGAPVYLVHNGDLTQGVKYPSPMVSDIGTQIIAGASNMKPWLKHKNVKNFKIVWGTDSHILGQGTAPRLIHGALEREYPDVEFSIAKHALLQYGGLWFDIAHHGPGQSIRNWLAGNTARYYTRSLCFDYITDGKRPPDAVIRSHFHSRIEEYLVHWYKQYGRVKTEFVLTPSYQGINEYTRQVTKSIGYSINGHVAFEIENGKIIETHWFTDARSMRDVEVES